MSTESYDPGAPEGDIPSRGQYMTMKDARVILLWVAVFGIMSIPVYRYMLQRTESSRCTRNMQGISEALTLYATEHDGRYPPLDRTESLAGITPSLGDSGHVYTWASDISGYMNVRASFLCPSAETSELVVTEDPKGANKTFTTSYGMYSAYGSCLTSLVEKPDQTIIIAETSNQGALNTFDPTPMVSHGGQPLPDGFAIGWSDSNDVVSNRSTAVTRLAFPNTKGGVFQKHGDARHGDTIHVLSSSGQLMDLAPTSANFGTLKSINPNWTLPPTSQVNR